MRHIITTRWLILSLSLTVTWYGCDETTDGGGGAGESSSDRGAQITMDMAPESDFNPMPDLWVEGSMDMRRSTADDMNALDMVQADDMEIIVDMAQASLRLQLDTPAEGITFDEGQEITVQGSVSVEGGSLEFVVVEATLDDIQSLPLQIDRDTGRLSAVISAPDPGEHALTLRAAMAPDYRAAVTRRFSVACERINEFDLPLDETSWVSKGPAIRDQRGWIELTQNQLNTRGALFWAGSPVSPGDLDIEFSFSTSKCDEPGPCSLNRINAGGGFAINFWDVPPAGLEGLWSVTRGLGNTLPAALLDEAEVARAESFHVVFDTYSNTCAPCGMNAPYDGCGNAHIEPTHVNHVAVILNGHSAIHGEPDESGSYCHLGEVPEAYTDRWGAFPDLDDGEWHSAHLTIVGTRVQLSIDDTPLIDFELPQLRFKGGILSLSAGSGVNGNFHRIDRLRVNELCQ